MSFNIALTGIAAAQKDLDVTANNIANVNTTGFKESRAEFADVYANGTDNVSQKAFNLLLGHTAEIAFNNPDTALKEYAYDVQLKILTNIMSEYLGLSDNQKKSDGV